MARRLAREEASERDFVRGAAVRAVGQQPEYNGQTIVVCCRIPGAYLSRLCHESCRPGAKGRRARLQR